jgi:hypothetical protein
MNESTLPASALGSWCIATATAPCNSASGELITGN